MQLAQGCLVKAAKNPQRLSEIDCVVRITTALSWSLSSVHRPIFALCNTTNAIQRCNETFIKFRVVTTWTFRHVTKNLHCISSVVVIFGKQSSFRIDCSVLGTVSVSIQWNLFNIYQHFYFDNSIFYFHCGPHSERASHPNVTASCEWG